MTAAEMAYRTSTTDEASRDELVTQELSQVYYLASRIRERLPQHVELDDLVSAGVVGLIEAAAKLRSLEKYSVPDICEIPNSRRNH